jgi:hypothetical protein
MLERRRPAAVGVRTRAAHLVHATASARALAPSAARRRRSLRSFRLAYGASQGVFRAGANPTGMRATSFSDLMSMTETSLVCSFAT